MKVYELQFHSEVVLGRENMENRRPFTRKFNWKRQAIKKEVVATPVKKIARADEGNEG